MSDEPKIDETIKVDIKLNTDPIPATLDGFSDAQIAQAEEDGTLLVRHRGVLCWTPTALFRAKTMIEPNDDERKRGREWAQGRHGARDEEDPMWWDESADAYAHGLAANRAEAETWRELGRVAIESAQSKTTREAIRQRDEARSVLRDLASWDDDIPEQIPAEIGACIDAARALLGEQESV